MAKIELTPDQRAAVENRGGSLLVSAAAGSGKTRVLVDRLFRYIRQEQCAVDDFLIITYTKAAAAELRGKIASELARQVAEHPEDAHLRRQLFRVYQADIKTVDAFCAALLRENVYLLPPVEGHSLTPDFRVLDEREAGLVKERVLERTMEDFYAGMTSGGRSWQKRWVPAGMTGRWKNWWRSCTASCRAIPTPCNGWKRCAGIGKRCRRS